MDEKKKQIVMVVDDSLLICKQVKMALKDEPYLSAKHTLAERQRN